jgi:signal transduction histidine kinase
MPSQTWFPQQLVAFMEAIWSSATEATAGLIAVERAAEALDAEVAAIVSGDRLVAAVGYPEGAVPVGELSLFAADGSCHELTVPGAGASRAACVALDYPPGAAFILARAGPDGGLRHDEASLLRGMARVTSMAMRTQRLLGDERAAREESEGQATENARLLAELTHRQVRLTELADEQAALRRVATLVAAQAPADRIFNAVAEAAAQLFRADVAGVTVFDPDGRMTLVAGWSWDGTRIPVGQTAGIDTNSIALAVQRSGRPARVDLRPDGSGSMARTWDAMGLRSAIGTPIFVSGRVWGVLSIGSRRAEPLPAIREQRLADFTGLVATAISNAQVRREVSRLADEQAALRRVATLVATGVAPGEVFDAVTVEMRLLLDADIASLVRFEADGTATIVAANSEPGAEVPLPTRLTLDETTVAAAVRTSGHTARVDRSGAPAGSMAAAFRALGMRAAAGAPVIVEGSLWGALVADWSDTQAMPPDTEGRIAQFTQLVATAISNASSRAQLAASRARIVATADETRRRLERDLHDGIQQRLVTLALELRTVLEAVPPGNDGLLDDLSHAGDELISILDELREISRGVHPAVLTEGGLGLALPALARRASVQVELDIGEIGRLPPPAEAAAYYVVSEALTNAAKHANATVVRVVLAIKDLVLRLSIADDGDGGADSARGSGIIGLTDRVDALGGKLTLRSPPGEGTSLVIDLPLELG